MHTPHLVKTWRPLSRACIFLPLPARLFVRHSLHRVTLSEESSPQHPLASPGPLLPHLSPSLCPSAATRSAEAQCAASESTCTHFDTLQIIHPSIHFLSPLILHSWILGGVGWGGRWAVGDLVPDPIQAAFRVKEV